MHVGVEVKLNYKFQLIWQKALTIYGWYVYLATGHAGLWIRTGIVVDTVVKNKSCACPPALASSGHPFTSACNARHLPELHSHSESWLGTAIKNMEILLLAVVRGEVFEIVMNKSSTNQC
jgi:hypothetical protein